MPGTGLTIPDEEATSRVALTAVLALLSPGTHLCTPAPAPTVLVLNVWVLEFVVVFKFVHMLVHMLMLMLVLVIIVFVLAFFFAFVLVRMI